MVKGNKMENLLQGVSVYLIGMMGVGKSTIGKILAKHLEYRFFDTDILIQEVTGKTINDIFAIEGEEKFRNLESLILAELAPYTKSVIATGGGIVTQQQNWSYLHHGLIVWLDAPIDLLMERLAEDRTRPLLKSVDPKKKLESLLEERQSLYAQGDLHIVIRNNQTPKVIVHNILDSIPSIIKKKSFKELN